MRRSRILDSGVEIVVETREARVVLSIVEHDGRTARAEIEVEDLTGLILDLTRAFGRALEESDP